MIGIGQEITLLRSVICKLEEQMEFAAQCGMAVWSWSSAAGADLHDIVAMLCHRTINCELTEADGKDVEPLKREIERNAMEIFGSSHREFEETLAHESSTHPVRWVKIRGLVRDQGVVGFAMDLTDHYIAQQEGHRRVIDVQRLNSLIFGICLVVETADWTIQDNFGPLLTLVSSVKSSVLFDVLDAAGSEQFRLLAGSGKDFQDASINLRLELIDTRETFWIAAVGHSFWDPDDPHRLIIGFNIKRDGVAAGTAAALIVQGMDARLGTPAFSPAFAATETEGILYDASLKVWQTQCLSALPSMGSMPSSFAQPSLSNVSQSQSEQHRRWLDPT
jgi:hypothetical protein